MRTSFMPMEFVVSPDSSAHAQQAAMTRKKENSKRFIAVKTLLFGRIRDDEIYKFFALEIRW